MKPAITALQVGRSDHLACHQIPNRMLVALEANHTRPREGPEISL